MKVPQLTALIDNKIKDAGGTPRHTDKGPRGHLGASIIGRKCEREIYYSFRWATQVQFEGRMLRLFDRGHEEEFRFVEWLELVGAKLETIDPATVHTLWYHDGSDCYVTHPPGEPVTEAMARECDDVTDIVWHVERAKTMGVILPAPRQHGFKDETGHYAGSMDAIAWDVPFINLLGLPPYTRILGEFKTHNAKSFAKLEMEKVEDKEGVELVKAEHYAQMVTYMEAKQLPAALYFAVNKDTDALYPEFVLPNPRFAQELKVKAHRIIFSPIIPPRMSNNPFWFECKFCDHRASCHYGAPLQKNCRTCRHSRPVAEGKWVCLKWSAFIPEDAQRLGCDAWQTIHD